MLINEHLTRQVDLIPMQVLTEKVTLIGAGAVGGWTALALAKMGFTDITVYDDDNVTVENMNCQFYRFSDIGKNKAAALQALVKDFTKVEINAIADKYKSGPLSGIVIAAVDSMSARSMIFENQSTSVNTKLLLDPRMGAELVALYAIQPMKQEDVEVYKRTLYSDDVAARERCTAKATIYGANLLSGLVAKTVKEFLVNKTYSRAVTWDIPSGQMVFAKDKIKV